MKEDIYTYIKEGKIDINNQEKFFGTLIKGLLLKLDDDIKIRNISVPHYIMHTGDDIMYLKNKGYDNSLEPLEVTNENYIYSMVPKCIVKPSGVDIQPDQFTSPYSIGNFQLDYNNNLYNIKAEFRRMPVKMSVELKYFVDSYTDLLELIQQIISKLCFIKTYNIVYMGQMIKCSYKIPEAFSGEFLTEIEGSSTEDRCKTLPLTLEIETSYPVFAEKTVMDPSKITTNIGWNATQSGTSQELNKAK